MSNNYRPDYFEEITKAMDPLVHGMTVVPEPHRMTHDGFMFHASGKVTGLANAGTADFLMVTPANTYPHIQRVEMNLEAGDIDLVMYEGVTTSADGSALTVDNVNRNSEHVNGALIYGGPTITDLGTVFHTIWVPPTSSGVGNSVGVIDINQGEEWVLAPSTKYAFRITNNSGGVIKYSYEFVWYEVGYED